MSKCFLVCLLLAVHFVTTADAGTQVLCMLNSVGSINPPNWIRVLWCFLEGAIAGGLLLAGGLAAIQLASIVIGLPIALFLLVTAYSLLRSLREDTVWPVQTLMMRPAINDVSLRPETGQLLTQPTHREMA